MNARKAAASPRSYQAADVQRLISTPTIRAYLMSKTASATRSLLFIAGCDGFTA